MRCTCKCSCDEEFDLVDKERLLNTIQHGRLSQKEITFAMKRLDITVCEKCFSGNHKSQASIF